MSVATSDTVRIEDVREVLRLRMENDRGQRVAAYILVSRDEVGNQAARLIIMDDSESMATRGFVFDAQGAVVDADAFMRFLRDRKLGGVKIDEEGKRISVRPRDITTVELPVLKPEPDPRPAA